MCIFWFLPNRPPPSLTRVKKQCQHMPLGFGIIYFVPKLLQPAFKAIPRTPCTRLTPVQLGKTLLCPWPFAFHPRKPNAPIHFPSFYLPRQIHKNHPPALHRQQASISYRASFLLSPAKNLGLLVAMAGSQRPDEGPSNAPPVIHRRVE